MEIKLELLKKYISDYVNRNIEDFEINTDDIANSVAIEMIKEIKEIILDDNLSDFDIVERITAIFEERDIDFGVQHDFG